MLSGYACPTSHIFNIK